MILNRFRFRPWSDVLDYGWVGGVPTELWIRFKHNTVNLTVDASDHDSIDGAFKRHVKSDVRSQK